MSLDSSRLRVVAHQVSAFSASLSGGSIPARSFPIHTYNPEKVDSQTTTVYKSQTTTVYKSHLHPINSFISSLCRATRLLSSLFNQILLITNYKSNKMRHHWSNNRTVKLTIQNFIRYTFFEISLREMSTIYFYKHRILPYT